MPSKSLIFEHFPETVPRRSSCKNNNTKLLLFKICQESRETSKRAHLLLDNNIVENILFESLRFMVNMLQYYFIHSIEKKEFNEIQLEATITSPIIFGINVFPSGILFLFEHRIKALAKTCLSISK